MTSITSRARQVPRDVPLPGCSPGLGGGLKQFEAQGNEWQQTSPSGTAPTARTNAAADWSNSADGLYIFGGQTGGGRALRRCGALPILRPCERLAVLRPYGLGVLHDR